MERDTGGTTGAPDPADASANGGPAATSTAAGTGTTRSYLTTATGEQVELPPEAIRALRSPNAANPVDIAHADGTRLTLVPSRVRKLPPGSVVPTASSPAAGTDAATPADGSMMFRRTTADRYAANKASSPSPEEAAAGATPDQEAEDAIAAAAMEALAPGALSTGKGKAVVVPVSGRPVEFNAPAPAEPLPSLEPLDSAAAGGTSEAESPPPSAEGPASTLPGHPDPSDHGANGASAVPAGSPAADRTPQATGRAIIQPAPTADPLDDVIAAIASPASPPPAAPIAPAPSAELESGAAGVPGETSVPSAAPEAAAPPAPAAPPLAPPPTAPRAEPAATAQVAPLAPPPVHEPPAASAPPPPAERGRDEGGMGEEDPGAQTSMGRVDAANTEFRSEEIDEILTSMPGGLLRWGITAVFATLVVLLGIAWYVRYPDVVMGRVSLTTPTPPVRVVSRAAGEVARVFAPDRATVAAGAPLLLLKNPARWDDVQALSASLDRLEPALQRSGEAPELGLDRALTLGELQAPYASFLQAYSDYRTHLADPFYAQKVAALRAQMATHEQLRERLNAQQQLLTEQLALADRSRTRSRQLATQNLSSSAEVDQAEQAYLQQRYATENGRTALANNEIQLAAQRAGLLDLEQRRADDGQRLLVGVRNAHRSLRAAISQWEQSYLLRSPVGGTVSMFRDLHENQFVAAQEPLVAVLPAAGVVMGRVTLSGVGAGKVRVGQRAILRLDSYPYREYGTVEGRVTRISQLGFEPPAQGGSPTLVYQADVALDHGLQTSYGRRLNFTQEMRGEVQVVTDDLRLLERVLNQLRSLREL
ncbi:MAG TPA: hypothetical protein VFH27_14660 [Longimicrobiaceae bacterium]|nr:hypothetical protein [Longimicrobiaceae bacterium]